MLRIFMQVFILLFFFNLSYKYHDFQIVNKNLHFAIFVVYIYL